MSTVDTAVPASCADDKAAKPGPESTYDDRAELVTSYNTLLCTWP
ncbi:hypothetical protein [Saccharopolyspora phatthalungensis]|uniref:Uncharacterized protein n=1 Tax=Saccharopolyspora phatthalungensis TaxID=664693 RepID=A0A840QE21_9PSEU|nr:hypothetical protein [Saccharopolyspora phatthalungensis]MBB5158211.1 hypothetical protein [Saccharopolyspora phatthalungensis]